MYLHIYNIHKNKTCFCEDIRKKYMCVYVFWVFFLEKWNLFIKERSSINYLKLVRSTLTLWNETCFLSNNK